MHWIIKVTWCVFVLALILTVKVFADDIQKPPIKSLTYAEQYNFQSKTLGETLSYFVSLPASYDVNKSLNYPIIFMLDGGEEQTLLAVSAARINYQTGPFAIPEAIIVGLPSLNRFRDYTSVKSEFDFLGNKQSWLKDTGGAETYLHFLRNEFLPNIAATYRTNGHKVIIGHSIGGLFALHDLVSENRLFNGYVVIDPSLWFADRHMDKVIKGLDVNVLDFKGGVYSAIALLGGRDDKRKTSTAFISNLKAKAGKHLDIRQKIYMDENHSSVVWSAFSDGLRHIFHGYTAPSVMEIINDPNVVKRHYTDFSKRVGFEYAPEMIIIGIAARQAIESKEYDSAKTLINILIQSYPKYADGFMIKGEYFETQGDRLAAQQVYKDALELDPKNLAIQSKLRSLGNNAE